MSLSPDDELHKKLEERERTQEKKWIETNRPSIGKYSVRWDGIVRWFMGLNDRLLWKWFEEDVHHSQQWEKRLRQKREQEQKQKDNPLDGV